MNFLKFFLKKWTIPFVALFLFLASLLLVLLFNAGDNHPQGMDFWYVAGEINISLVLVLSFLLSLFMGLIFSAYDFFVPKSKMIEEES